jgi:hypothetical protein
LVFLAWLRRSFLAIRHHKRDLGQAVFLCGAVNCGKTLLAQHVIMQLLGGRYGNQTDYFHGLTTFTEDLLENALLLIDDEAPGKTESERSKFAARVKSFTVNPIHSFHPKYCPKTEIDWIGRLFAALNDDPASVGVLPEVNEATRDKLMFFRLLSYPGTWPANIEETLRREVPYLAYWLEHVFVPPAEVLSNDRMGVKSYFDPTILELSRQQSFGYNALELIKTWINTTWDEKQPEWVGSPTELLSNMDIHDHLKVHVRDWNTLKLAKSLTALARQGNTGVEFAGQEHQRSFKIIREKALNV